MRSLAYAGAGFAVLGLAFWAYRENYATQAALDRVGELEAAIAAEREALSVLRAEWAFLNRPDRLRDLADLNFDRLGLMPFLPEQFAAIDQVAYPATESLLPGLGAIDGGIDAFGRDSEAAR
jgi:hypothetical protein